MLSLLKSVDKIWPTLYEILIKVDCIRSISLSISSYNFFDLGTCLTVVLWACPRTDARSAIISRSLIVSRCWTLMRLRECRLPSLTSDKVNNCSWHVTSIQSTDTVLSVYMGYRSIQVEPANNGNSLFMFHFESPTSFFSARCFKVNINGGEYRIWCVDSFSIFTRF